MTRSWKSFFLDTEGFGRNIYNITGFDPYGVVPDVDYYGKDIQRQYATTLDSARQQQYDAAQRQIAEKFKQARIRAIQNAQARGLQSSGMAQKQTSDLYAKQADTESQVYANLLADEQKFLDQMYLTDKQLAFEIARQQRAEELARQQMTMDLMNEIIGAVAGMIGDISGNISSPVGTAATAAVVG